jgi:hypothetical protein
MIKRKPQSHLINILKSTADHHPNFVVLLGAGSSKTSGVKLAGELISDWRISHYKMYHENGETKEQYLSKHFWYNSPEEYSILFEELYDQPSQRREFIESCIIDAFPSWGYIYLVNLLRNRVFNTVFTTNFDDLLNESCYQFSNEVRPIVCSHDSSISTIRITSNRPKIIKLHGDFLFDNIKNTVRELETLEQNTQDKFKQYASEFGFIVIGYSGNDRSIMDTFNTLLRFDQYFPHGIYWCIRKDVKLSKNVELLSRFPKFHIIEIDGFDEFFAELNNELSIPLQQEMTNPYASLAMRLNRLIDKINLPEDSQLHPVIERDIQRLGNRIEKLSPKSSTGEVVEINKVEISGNHEKLPIPFGLLSNLSFREGDFNNAFRYRVKELETDPSPKSFVEIFKLMFLANRVEECKQQYLDKYFQDESLISKEPMTTFDASLIFISNSDYETADKILDFGNSLAEKYGGSYYGHFYFLNKMQIIKHRGIDYTETQSRGLKKLVEKGDINTRIGALSLLGEIKDVENLLLKLKEKEDISYLVSWPILDFIRSEIKNPELKKQLTTKAKKS